jgi:spore maturation protein CgeB
VRVVMFYHSLVSDWNHGNAHFLRGIVTEMLSRGIDVDVYEPKNAWSVENLVREHGREPLAEFKTAYPALSSIRYDAKKLNIDEALEGADIVIVHEWNDRELVKSIGRHHKRVGGYRLYFHDTHHRAATAPEEIAEYDLSGYDGLLAYGKVIRDLYLKNRWAKRAWTWHEAADIRTFYPRMVDPKRPHYDIVWIGNWGDDERSSEIREYLIEPVKKLGLKALVHGVRFPEEALDKLEDVGIEYGGWLPNFKAPMVFAEAKLTVHIPRRPYVKSLPGIPTIRPFEALASGIPLISAWWNDTEKLFTPGEDFLMVKSGGEMTRKIERVLGDENLRQRLASRGRETILARHTCAHRVDELMAIDNEIRKLIVQRVMTA